VLGPLRDIGRQTGGLLAERLGAGAGPGELFAAFLDEISGPRQRARRVVVVEDVHWADEATLDWLAFLGRRIDRFPALLVLTYRDDELGLEHPLRGTLATLPSGAVHRIALAPLSEATVGEQAESAGRDPAVVYRLCGGNPLLLTELLKAGDAVPAAVQDLILDRLRALPPAARDLAQLVSVVPTRAEAALVADAPDSIDEAIAGGVLVSSGDGVAFRHELLRGAVEGALSTTRRLALHRRVLAALSGFAGVDPGRLLHHAVLAADSAAVLHHGQVAGAAAARQGAHREAAAHYRAAAASAAVLGPAERAALLEAYAEQAYLAGLHEEGLRARRDALRLREELRQPERMAENLRWVSRLAWWTGDAATARDAANRAVTVLAGSGDDQQLAMAYGNLAHLHCLNYELDDAIAWGERAERLGNLDTALNATISVQTARLARDEPGAREALQAAHQTAAAHGFSAHASRALANLGGVVSDELAQYAEAAQALERVYAYTVAQNLDGYLLLVLGFRARIRLERGDWDGALADADAIIGRSAGTGVNVVLPLAVKGRILAARGDADALPALDAALREALRINAVQYVAPVAEARSEYFRWAGEPERAQHEALRGLELAATVVGQPFVTGRLAYRYRRAGGAGPLPDGIAGPYQLMIDGDWQRAAAEWERRGAIYLRAEAMAAGDEPAALEALRCFGELGAVRAADDVRVQLRRQGVTRVPRGPRRATAEHAAGLTPRQAHVLELLAERLSNADIARRLTLSPKTVDHHVSAVLNKLGVANRAQAIAAVHRRSLGRAR
jgi:DNA-binding CsgD family transcriptional regulator